MLSETTMMLWMMHGLSASKGEGPAPAPAPSYWLERYQEADTQTSEKNSESEEEKDASAVFLYYADRTLDDTGAWAPIDEPTGLGLEFVSNADGFGFEFGLAYTEDSTEVGAVGGLAVEVFSKFFEASVGARLSLAGEHFVAYVGAGGAYVNAEAELTVGGIFTDGGTDDDTFGVYLHGGAYLKLSNFLVGVDYRVLGGADVDLEFSNGTVSTNADYSQVAFMIGAGS